MREEERKSREGRCYELAWKHILRYEEGTLIHVELWSPELRKMIGHSLVETETGYIYEPVVDSYFDKAWLYRTFKVKEIKSYTPTEASINAARYGHFGPWGS